MSAQIITDLRPGQVWLAYVEGKCKDRHMTGKIRPVVLVDVPEISCLRVASLTSQCVNGRGEARQCLRETSSRLLRRRSYVFEQLSSIPRINLIRYVAQISAADAEALSQVHGLTTRWEER